jgi:DNA-binding NtrC family response regulator
MTNKHRNQIRRMERDVIMGQLNKCNGSVSDAAKLMGMPLSTLWNRVYALGIRRRQPRSGPAGEIKKPKTKKRKERKP